MAIAGLGAYVFLEVSKLKKGDALPLTSELKIFKSVSSNELEDGFVLQYPASMDVGRDEVLDATVLAPNRGTPEAKYGLRAELRGFSGQMAGFWETVDPAGKIPHELPNKEFPLALQKVFFNTDLAGDKAASAETVAIPVLVDGEVAAAKVKFTDGVKLHYKSEEREVLALAFFKQPTYPQVDQPTSYTAYILECSGPIGTYQFIRERCEQILEGYRFVSPSYFGE